MSNFFQLLNELFVIKEDVELLSNGDIKVKSTVDIPKNKISQMVKDLNRKGYDTSIDFIEKISKRHDGIISKEIYPDQVETIKSFLFKEKKEKSLEEKIFYLVSRYFGLTNDLKLAGYILPNGNLLDFSGRRQGRTGVMDDREMDHRQIGQALENLKSEHPSKHGGSEGMWAFMKLGPIRMDFNSGAVDVAKEPTEQQYRVLMKFMTTTPSKYIVVDLSGKGEDKNFSLEEFEKNKMIRKIREYYSGRML